MFFIFFRKISFGVVVDFVIGVRNTDLKDGVFIRRLFIVGLVFRVL